MSITTADYESIAEKAKHRKDGIYTLKGINYRVKGCKVTHFANNCEIFEIYGNFVVPVASYRYSRESIKLLKSIK